MTEREQANNGAKDQGNDGALPSTETGGHEGNDGALPSKR